MTLYIKTVVYTTTTLFLWTIFTNPHLGVFALLLPFVSGIAAGALVSNIVEEIKRP